MVNFYLRERARKNRNEKSGIYCAYLLIHLPRILSIASGSCEPSHWNWLIFWFDAWMKMLYVEWKAEYLKKDNFTLLLAISFNAKTFEKKATKFLLYLFATVNWMNAVLISFVSWASCESLSHEEVKSLKSVWVPTQFGKQYLIWMYMLGAISE